MSSLPFTAGPVAMAPARRSLRYGAVEPSLVLLLLVTPLPLLAWVPPNTICGSTSPPHSTLFLCLRSCSYPIPLFPTGTLSFPESRLSPPSLALLSLPLLVHQPPTLTAHAAETPRIHMPLQLRLSPLTSLCCAAVGLISMLCCHLLLHLVTWLSGREQAT